MNLAFICGVAGLGLTLAGCGKPVESSAVVVDEGRQLVMDSIAAHGGTEKWYGRPAAIPVDVSHERQGAGGGGGYAAGV